MAADRKERLTQFVKWVGDHITGDEKGQAQIFLDRLFLALGHKGCLDVGGTPEFRIRKPKESGGGTAFADYVWKPHVLIEMKKRRADLSKHYRQAFDYWVRLVPGRPRYVILCNFDEFWVYDFETQMDTPVDRLRLVDLPDRWGPLAFLFPSHDRPVFGNDQEEVTRAAADKLVTCFNSLLARKVPREQAQRFVLQMLVALFAEDIDLLPRYFVARLLDDCKAPADSFDLLGGLFEAMNTPKGAGGGRFKGVDYFNGGLFAEPARVELYQDELNQLREAAKKDWSCVRPEIFGTLFEHSLEQGERHAYGGHFTTAVDIMKIIQPTIVEPWRDAIEKAATGVKPVETLGRLHRRMQDYCVLDPACGSGNFLYLAYRELKRLEKLLFEALGRVSKSKEKTRRMSFVTAGQFYGMDINPFAIEIAKVTMMIARKLAIDELRIAEAPLPLDNLDGNFKAVDALIHPVTENGEPVPTMLFAELDQNPWAAGRIVPTQWPRADVIIGNPPFLGAKRLKPERGADYVNAVRKTYNAVPGMADYCVYWFRLAHDHLPECTRDDPVAGRAGLVGTQNIRNNKSREGGLDHIVKTGTIIEAVDNQPWSGDANVHVSIVNWVKHGPLPIPALRDGSACGPRPLPHGRGSDCVPEQNRPGAPGSGAAQSRAEQNRDREGVTDNAPDLRTSLIPPKRRLWYKVDAPKGREKIRRASAAPAHKDYELAFRDAPHINSALSDQADVSSASQLAVNTNPQCVFQGLTPGHSGFVLSRGGRTKLLEKDKLGSEVIYPYLIGRDVLTSDGTPTRHVIDFQPMTVLEAQRYPAAFRHVKTTVLPDREAKAEEGKDSTGRIRSHHKQFLENWWRLSWERSDLIEASAPLGRFLVCSRVTKRPVFVFVSNKIRPGDALQAFTFEDDYSFGILQSNTHWQWFVAKCSKLKSDFRYTPESVFDTFPWPQSPTRKQVNAVAEAGRAVRRIRGEALAKIKGGLRAVYRTLELPGKNPLKDAHAALDAAVLAAYGFSAKDDLLRQLLDLNLQVADRIDRGQPVTAPGVPPNYGDPAALVTSDCIRPPAL